VLIEEKLGKICASLETSQTKVAQQMSTSASSARNSTKLLHLRPYKTAVVYHLCDTYCKARLNFVKLCGVHGGEVDHTHVLCGGNLLATLRICKFSQ
jgi:hypothetical protein